MKILKIIWTALIWVGAVQVFAQSAEVEYIQTSPSEIVANESAESLKNTNDSLDIAINICRIKSIIRSVEAPDLYVNNVKVGELSNGAKLIHHAKTGDVYAVKTLANPLLFRFKDELLAKGIVHNESVYSVVRVERNIAKGLGILFGGAMLESVRQNIDTGDTKDWTTTVVAAEDYQSKCSE
jgi:hypothetical protein